MQTFSSHHIPCPPTADVTHLILCTLSSHCTTFFLYCQCDPPGTAHFLYSYCRCDIPDTTDFLLTPRTLFSHCRCSPSDIAHSLLTLHNFLIVLQMQPSWYCTLLSLYHRCDFSDTADFLCSHRTPSLPTWK